MTSLFFFFAVEHFSLFAVVLVEPYPQTDIILEADKETSVVVSSIPEVMAHFPSGCVQESTEVTLKVLYGDHRYHRRDEDRPLASPVLSATAHGGTFEPGRSVRIQLPIPQGSEVFGQFGPCSVCVLCM